MPANIKKPTLEPEYDIPTNLIAANILSAITGVSPQARAEIAQQFAGLPPFEMPMGLAIGMSRRYTPTMKLMRELSRTGNRVTSAEADYYSKLPGTTPNSLAEAKRSYRAMGRYTPSEPSASQTYKLRKALAGDPRYQGVITADEPSLVAAYIDRSGEKVRQLVRGLPLSAQEGLSPGEAVAAVMRLPGGRDLIRTKYPEIQKVIDKALAAIEGYKKGSIFWEEPPASTKGGMGSLLADVLRRQVEDIIKKGEYGRPKTKAEWEASMPLAQQPSAIQEHGPTILARMPRAKNMHINPSDPDVINFTVNGQPWAYRISTGLFELP